MARLAVVGGNATRDIDLGGGDWAAIDRHGEGGYVLPHEIDHEANLRSLLRAGCDRVLAIASVGGLHPQLGPGTFLCPDDLVALQGTPTTLDGRGAHTLIGFDTDWRARVLEEWAARAEPPLVDGGVYWQAPGPRLETAAEIRHIARDADVIGMTIASECAIACELGLPYAAICVVVNYANGVGDVELTRKELDAGRALAGRTLAGVPGALLPVLA